MEPFRQSLNQFMNSRYKIPSKNKQLIDVYPKSVVFNPSDVNDWYEMGVFIYQPEIDTEKPLEYVEIGKSSQYVNDDQTPTPIYIHRDLHSILSEYLGSYTVVDEQEDEGYSLTYIASRNQN